MINFIRGALIKASLNSIIVDVNGIGYKAFIPSSVFYSLPKAGEILQVYTYLHVREDVLQLYGFLNEKDLELFEVLINVSGIGPKNGLNILSAISSDQFAKAVLSEDLVLLTKIPGIGKKTAQRMILELKDKVKAEEIEGNFDSSTSGNVSSAIDGALDALVALGYHHNEAKKALDNLAQVKRTERVEDIIREALKVLAKG